MVMRKELIVSVTPLENKIAVLEDDQLVEFYIERRKNRGILGNIYKGRVTKVLPGMQSAFVDIGLDKDAFLYVSDFFEETDEYERIFSSIDEKAANAAEQMLSEELRGRSARRPRPRQEERALSATDKKSRTEPLPLETDNVIEKWYLERSQERAVGWDNNQRMQAEMEASIRGQGDLEYFYAPRHRRRGNSGRPRRDHARRSKFNPEGKHRTSDKIENLLREGQEILVQVAKEAIGKKGARVTSHIALPGKYLVYMPTVDHIGVSRKIGSETERIRLRDIVLRHKDGCSGGFIVRTAGEGQSEENFQADINYLVSLWDEVKGKCEKVSAPALVHSELNLIARILRDQLSGGFNLIKVDDEVTYESILDFVNKFQPLLLPRIKLHTKEVPIFEDYGIHSEIEKAMHPKVWLKSGGYIVINQTEALVAIDVNTGKFVGKSDSLEETITNTNFEAIREIVRQIRLRDLGGIIVIDFIDMQERKNRRRIMDALELELAKDKSPIKILEFNEFGLVAITRKRVKQSLERTLCQICSYCNGAGFVRSVITTCYAIYDEIRKMAKHLEGDEVTLRVHPDVARALRESERVVIDEIKHLTKKEVTIKPDSLLHISRFDIIN